MRRLFIFLFGYCRFSVRASDAARLLDMLKNTGILARSMSFSEDCLSFSVSLSASKAFLSECERAGIEAVLLYKRGLPCLLSKYKRRLGVIIGALTCICIIFFSSRVIWDIRVDGNRRLTDAEVISELKLCGLEVGKVKRRLDTDSIQNRVMINSDDISWISINIIGTVAEVQIRECEPINEEDEPYDAANIVAAKDGYIERFEDTRGNVIAEVGELVREGELLVSGLYDSPTVGFRYTVARGKVMARTESEISVSIPLQYQKKVYTGREFTEKYLIFFEKEIKFFGNCGNLPTTCDTIDMVEYCNFFSAGDLPVGIRTVIHREYRYEDALRTEVEATELAFDGLSEKLSELAKNAELLRKSTEVSVGEDAVTLKCKIEAIEDIARIQEIKIS